MRLTATTLPMASDKSDELLDKADALMRRHRPVAIDAAPEVTESNEAAADDINDSDDLPVLTEVVDPHDAAPALTPRPTARDERTQLSSALTAELETWLDEALPGHIVHVLDGLADQLVGQLSQRARAELLPRLQALAEAEKPAPTPDSSNTGAV